MIDWTSDLGVRTIERLENDLVIWLVTLDGKNVPQPSPVWFWWDGETLLIYSKPNAAKMRNIDRQPQVALHFNSSDDGEDIQIITGTAERVENPTLSHQFAPYAEKYRTGTADIGMTPEQLGTEYSAAFRVTPTKLRGV